MSAWLLSIIGITIVGTLTELLLTDSPMSKFVRSIYAFFILFVIVQPIPNLLNNASKSVSGDFVYDSKIVAVLNENSAASLIANCESALETAGIKNAVVTIDYDKTNPSFHVTRVYVNVGGNPNNSYGKIINIVTALCGVSESDVEVYL